MAFVSRSAITCRQWLPISKFATILHRPTFKTQTFIAFKSLVIEFKFVYRLLKFILTLRLYCFRLVERCNVKILNFVFKWNFIGIGINKITCDIAQRLIQAKTKQPGLYYGCQTHIKTCCTWLRQNNLKKKKLNLIKQRIVLISCDFLKLLNLKKRIESDLATFSFFFLL